MIPYQLGSIVVLEPVHEAVALFEIGPIFLGVAHSHQVQEVLEHDSVGFRMIERYSLKLVQFRLYSADLSTGHLNNATI